MRDQAALAEVAGMTRAWVTVDMRLTLLAPDIQEALLPDASIDSRSVDSTARQLDWRDQRRLWQALPVRKLQSTRSRG